MIVDLPDFESINRLADLPAGRYAIVESIYQAPGMPSCHAVLSEVVVPDTGRSVGADLQVVLPDATMLFRDFSIACDGAWRDSYGAKAASLADLLPPELAQFTLVTRQGVLVDHDGQGRLIPATNPEADNGP
jgi:hypothetical protein